MTCDRMPMPNGDEIRRLDSKVPDPNPDAFLQWLTKLRKTSFFVYFLVILNVDTHL